MDKNINILFKGLVLMGSLAFGAYSYTILNEHIKIQREGNIILKTLVKHNNISNE